jgi:membrane dipeptidase
MTASTEDIEFAESPEADRLYAESIVVDGLGPIFWYQPDFAEYLRRVVASGITAFNHTMAIPYDFRPDGMSELRAKLDDWERASDEFQDLLLIVRTVDDIGRAKAEGKVGVIFGLQNLGLIDEDLERLRTLHDWGIRIIGLTYQGQNQIGCGSGVPTDTGLTALGREAVGAMNELGLLVCLSHVGERTSMDAIEASTKPVVFSHINSRSLAPTSKNISDAEIEAIGNNGGAIGIASWSPNVSTKPRPGVKQFFEHVRYVADRIGIDKVGVGMDLAEGLPAERLQLLQENFPEISNAPFDEMYVPGLDTTESWPNVARGLEKEGYEPDEIRGVLGENFVRVFSEVWAS